MKVEEEPKPEPGKPKVEEPTPEEPKVEEPKVEEPQIPVTPAVTSAKSLKASTVKTGRCSKYNRNYPNTDSFLHRDCAVWYNERMAKS